MQATETMQATIERTWIEVTPDPEAEADYLEQDEFTERLEQYQRGTFGFVGVSACAEIRFTTPQGGWIIGPVVKSSGLWGIEDDSGEDYFRTVGEEQADELADMLIALGLDETRVRVAANMAAADLSYV